MTTAPGLGHDGGPTMNPALYDFWLATETPKGDSIRNRVLYGGRASSKSWDAAAWAVFLAANCKIRVLCARQFQNKIAESVYTLLKVQIERFGLTDQFDILDNTIRHKVTGSEFLFYGLWRHIDEIKSLEGIDICWLEEAHALTKEQWEVLEPTIRKEGSQFWIIFNPRLSTDFVWRRFVVNPPRGTIVRHINYNENPFLSSTMRGVIEAAKEEDEDDFGHVYLGIPRDDDDDAVIKRSWVMASIGAHKKLGIAISNSWAKRVGFDVADSGADKCATVAAHGPLAIGLDEWKAREDEILKSSKRAWGTACAHGADLTYDSIGVGAFVGAHVIEMNREVPRGAFRPSAIGFNAGDGVLWPDRPYARAHPPKSNKEMFSNLKAQAWWSVADRFRNTFNAVTKGMTFEPDEMIFIDEELPGLMALVDELCTPKRDYDNAGKVKVESKKDMAKPNREGGPRPSPNKADAFVMAFAPGLRVRKIAQDYLDAI